MTRTLGGRELLLRTSGGLDLIQWRSPSGIQTHDVGRHLLKLPIIEGDPIRIGGQWQNRPNQHGRLWCETSVEQSLVAHVCRGEWLDLAAGEAVDEDTMRSWGPSQTCVAGAREVYHDSRGTVRSGGRGEERMTSQPVAAYPRQRVRHWVPFALVVGLFVAANVAVSVTGSLVPEPHGHWTGHVGNATIDIGMIVIVMVGATLAWRRHGNLWVRLVAAATLAVVTLGLLLEAAGNLRVAHSIWRTPYGDEEVERIGSGFSGFDSGHDLASTGDLVVLLGGVAFALVLGFSRRVRLATALAAVVLSFIPPPFLIPACGVVFLLAALLRPRLRQG